jgi:hypothetical protein
MAQYVATIMDRVVLSWNALYWDLGMHPFLVLHNIFEDYRDSTDSIYVMFSLKPIVVDHLDRST